MSEIEVIRLLAAVAGGLVVGVLGTLAFNKLRSGSASPGKIKQELEDYQSQVEEHFEETSRKFKSMAAQYQDLYQHMSVGATTLCRPENQAAGLTDQSAAQAAVSKPAPKANDKTSPKAKDSTQTSKPREKAEVKKKPAEPGHGQGGGTGSAKKSSAASKPVDTNKAAKK